ncbi:saccharopine dehydrogenase-like oxidoreductase [Candidatus Sumerlaeota bacterium]|nr:saccharopine dehydrogenase-like oxidoreductase [Candidatus Sumerlaeota bacterium]
MNETTRRIAILGAGGLGRNAVRLLEQKSEFRLVAIGDSQGFVFNEAGIGSADFDAVAEGESVEKIGRRSGDSAAEVIALNKAGKIDAVFLAVPNIPNNFIPELIVRFCREGFRGVIVDALKRTSAVRQILATEKEIANSGVLYVTGAGATPGLLTAAANLAAQSFQEIDEVKIWFGVGMNGWEKHRATIREDIAHMPGFNIEKVRAMSDSEVEAVLTECKGLLELHNMEHADDILLERAGTVAAERVKVGGLVDVASAKKPVSTTMTLTGRTFEGKTSSHRFILGDETSMSANVLGPAFGWMKAGLELHDRGIRGLFSSADLMPKFVG